jgi:hypothetical protein
MRPSGRRARRCAPEAAAPEARVYWAMPGVELVPPVKVASREPSGLRRATARGAEVGPVKAARMCPSGRTERALTQAEVAPGRV